MNAKALSVAVCALACSTALAWDFEYGYQSVFAPNAGTYVVREIRIQKTLAGPLSFYTSTTEQPPAEITYHFTFEAPIEKAYLFTRLDARTFPYESPEASLWASTDGATWQNLLYATPTDIFEGSFYNQELPSFLLGDNDLWIQARLFSYSSGFAQFSRADSNVTGDIFQFKATLVPEPSTTLLLFAVGGIVLTCMIYRQRTM